MAEEVTNTMGSELIVLPPRKRFKIWEQQRRREEEEESPQIHFHCNDVTKTISLHRVLPDNVTSQGCLVLEKQKINLHQQEFSQNFVSEVPPLPSRPVAINRSETSALPLSGLPTPTLKFQDEKVHLPSPSAFKRWGSSSPKLGAISETSSQIPGSKNGLSEDRNDPRCRIPRHHLDSIVDASVVDHAKTWTMAKGTTCSINKAQEDVELMVGPPVLSSNTCVSETQVLVPMGTSSSAPTVAMDLVSSEAKNRCEVASYDHTGAARTCELDVMTSKFSSATDRGHTSNASLGVPEICFAQCTDAMTTGSPIVAWGECRTSADTSSVSKTSEELTNIGFSTKKARACPNFSDSRICRAGKREEPAAQLAKDAFVGVRDVEVVQNQVKVATTSSDSLAVSVSGEPGIQDSEFKQVNILAEIGERADILFKQMLEREGSEGCNNKQDSIADNSIKALASDFDSPVVGIDAEVEPMLKFQDSENASTPIHGDPVGSVICSENHQIDLGRPTFNVVVERPSMPSKKLTIETQDNSSRTSQAHEDSAELADQKIDSPISPGLNYESSMLQKQSQGLHCGSSKEDSDWDLEMEIPDFTFDKRIGMTQRVKAPGMWFQSSGIDSIHPAEDSGADNDGACDICRNPDAQPSDPIVYCDGCDIPVHAYCYGSPLSHGVPEGDWFCALCQDRSPNTRTCCLCPKSGGAMKMTTDGNWAHLSCAVFVPEVFFRNADNLEGIDTSHVPKRRWLSSCCVCNSTKGACVDCTEIGCKSSFHVSCALKKDLALEFRNARSGGGIIISFCQEHTAAWDEQQEARKAGRSKYKIVSREPQRTKAFQRSKLR